MAVCKLNSNSGIELEFKMINWLWMELKTTQELELEWQEQEFIGNAFWEIKCFHPGHKVEILDYGKYHNHDYFGQHWDHNYFKQ